MNNQHQEWIEQELMFDISKRDEKWPERIAVGNESFIYQVKTSLEIKAKHKEMIKLEDGYFIKEGRLPYDVHFDGKMDPLRVENSLIWDLM